MSGASDPYKKRQRHILIALSLALIILGCGLALLPLGIDYGLREWIRQHGGEQVSIANVDFNPFTATLRLDDLRITRQGKNTLALPRLGLQLAWRPLWNRQLVVTGLELSGLQLTLTRQHQDGPLQIGGLELPASASENETSTPWAIRLDRIALRDSTLHYQTPELSTRLQLERAILSGIATNRRTNPATLSLKGRIDQAPITLDGEITPFATQPGFSGDANLQGLALAPYAVLAKPNLQQLQGTLSLNGKLSLQTGTPGSPHLRHDGNFSLTDYQIRYQDQQLGGATLAWRGALDSTTGNHHLKGRLEASNTRFNPGTDGDEYRHGDLEWQGELTVETNRIVTSGRLHISDLAATLDEQSTTADQVELILEESRINLPGEELSARLPGQLQLTGIRLASPQQSLSSDTVSWQGIIELSRREQLTLTRIEGTFGQESSTWGLRDRQAAVSFGRLGWQGSLALTQQAQATRISPSGDLSLNGLTVIDEASGLQLLSLDTLNFEQLDGDSQSGMAAERFTARTLSVGSTPADNAREASPAQLTLDRLLFEQPGFSPADGLRVARIEANGLQQQLVRRTDESLNLKPLVDAIGRITGERDPQAPPLPLHIDQITLTGENRIAFEDRTREPVYRLRLQPQQASLNNVTNTPANQASPLQLKGILDDSSAVTLDGEVALFARDPTFKLQGRIEGLQLPPLSSYSIPLLGYRLQSGKANSDIQLTANAGLIDGGSDLILNQLEVQPLDSEKMQALQQQLSIPLETALGMLKDKHNRIKLNLPISGSVDNIQVDPSDAINQAIGRAMKKGAKTYLATALFPFGTLLTLVELAGDAAARIQLDPITFAPGSSLLNPDQHAYLGKVAQLLEDRPEVHIRLCGVATPDDIAALQQIERERRAKEATKEDKSPESEKSDAPEEPAAIEIEEHQLTRLAAARVVNVERYLTETHRTKSDRLISCQARIEKQPKSKPRIDLLI